MKVRYLTFEMYHGKKGIGSTNIRVHQLIKHWPEAGIYQYGENPDVLVLQKVYTQADYKFPHHFKGIKILDICDPDWLDHQAIKETVDAVDGVTVPTQALADFIRQLTDKPIKVIPDRFDTSVIPSRKIHKGKAENVVWFGYKQNAELLRFAIPTIERLGLKLTVISNEDPTAWRWAEDPDKFEQTYIYSKYDEEIIYSRLQDNDICVLPQGIRPQDRFKSNNKTAKAWLAGIPVATDGDELRKFLDPVARNTESAERYNFAIKEYDVVKSVSDMQEFIKELSNARR